MNKLSKILNRSFPEGPDLKKNLIQKLVISLFVTLFLVFIRPFGIDVSSESLPYLISIGLITFITSVVFDLIVIYILKIPYHGKKFTFKRWLILTLTLVVILTIVNYVYLSLLTGNGVQSLLRIAGITFMISLFPIFFIGTMSLISAEKKNEKLASDIDTFELFTKVKQDKFIFDIPIHSILFIEALQNYIQIVYIDESKKLCLKTERSTLKKAEELCQSTQLIKCHRSYIVNCANINRVTGNSQGLQCIIDGTEVQVPVSRSFISSFKAKMASYSSQK